MKFGPAPFLATHVVENVAWVNLIYVPPGQRRRGLGRHMFEDWLHSLPQTISKVKLVAAEVDGECAVEFWEKMGFDFEAIDLAMTDGVGAFMVREAHHEPAAA